MAYITLTKENIDTEHICCAFSDKKCSEGYKLKKEWLKNEFEKEYVFRRLDERAKVFIEYGPAENAWVPVTAPNYMMIGCFWVSGKYKQNGHGKALLNEVIENAKRQGKSGLVTVAGTKKFHFMSDTKWLVGQNFTIDESTSSGFSLLSLRFNNSTPPPYFNESVRSCDALDKNGCIAYYSNRCPYSEYYVNKILVDSCNNRNLPLKIIKIESMEQAQSAPTPATIFSLFIDGKFVTTNISACIEKKFEKILN